MTHFCYNLLRRFLLHDAVLLQRNSPLLVLCVYVYVSVSIYVCVCARRTVVVVQ
jgi:hypothetical protein